MARSSASNSDELVFLPLGGSGEIGMNLNCYGFGPPDARQWIVVDCGVTFGRETTTPGIDVIMPDVRFLEERRGDLLGQQRDAAGRPDDQIAGGALNVGARLLAGRRR